jgi:hypothetical protein
MEMTLDELEALAWTSMESSNLRRAAWVCMVESPQSMAEAEWGRLFVEFSQGRVYAYSSVSKEFFDELCEAESAGSFLNEDIKPYFDCEGVRIVEAA